MTDHWSICEFATSRNRMGGLFDIFGASAEVAETVEALSPASSIAESLPGITDAEMEAAANANGQDADALGTASRLTPLEPIDDGD